MDQGTVRLEFWRNAVRWIHNLKVSKKLSLGFGIVPPLMAGMGAFSLNQLARTNLATAALAGNWRESVRHWPISGTTRPICGGKS